MRKKRLKILYQDVHDLQMPETEHMQNKKTGQVVLSRNCKRFYKKLAKKMWKNSRTLLRIDPAVKAQLSALQPV